MRSIYVIIILAFVSCRAHQASDESETLNAESVQSRLKPSVTGNKPPLGSLKGVIISVTLDWKGGKDDVAADAVGDIILDYVLAGLAKTKELFTVVAINAESALSRRNNKLQKIIEQKDQKIINLRKSIEDSKIQNIDTRDEKLEQLFLMVYDDDTEGDAANTLRYRETFFKGIKFDRGQILVAIIDEKGDLAFRTAIPASNNKQPYNKAIAEFAQKMKENFPTQ